MNAIDRQLRGPKPRRAVENRNVTFIGTPPRLILQPTRHSPLRELPPAELVDDYASTDDLLRDARDYTAVLDLNVNIPAEHATVDSVDGDPRMEPIFEQIRDVTRKGLLIPPGGTVPETSSPSSAPNSMQAGDHALPVFSPAPSQVTSEAAALCIARPAPGSEPALSRARPAIVPPRR